MRRVEQGFTSFLYRPFFDLGPLAVDAPVAAWGVDFACRALMEGRDYPWMYAEYPPSFRERLLQLTGLGEYRVYDPRDLAPDLRTSRWQFLCEQVDRYQGLAPVAQFRVARLLGKLGLSRFALDLVQTPTGAEVESDELAAEHAYVRALACLLISEDGAGSFDETELERIARHAPQGSHVRILALNHLAVRFAKRNADAAAAGHWLDLHHQQILLARSRYGEATFARLMSRHHRANGFLPQLANDRAGVVREMDLCQQYAEQVPRKSSEERIAANELMFAALESRTKEALWLGELEIAELRARQLVELWPLDPLAHDHLGHVLVEQERIAEALEAYLSAARIGAPGAETAWFMAGQCYEALQSPERACDAYLAALRLDPLGISSLDRLVAVAEEIAHPLLATWSRARLVALTAEKSTVRDPPRLARYQQYAGKLGHETASPWPERAGHEHSPRTPGQRIGEHARRDDS